MDRADILEDNMKDIHSLIWKHCTEALQQGLHGNAYLEGKYISFDAKWLLNKINVTYQVIKAERHSDSYDSIYKLVWKHYNFC